jgi:hypothetical protein
VPGQASTGNARERHPNSTHPAAIVVGTESRATPSSASTGNASDRHRAHQRWEGTPSDAITGNARERHHVRQVGTPLRRGAAQPAHAARRRSGDEIGAILHADGGENAIAIYGAARLMRQALGCHH